MKRLARNSGYFAKLVDTQFEKYSGSLIFKTIELDYFFHDKSGGDAVLAAQISRQPAIFDPARKAAAVFGYFYFGHTGMF